MMLSVARDYIASNSRIKINNELIRIQKEKVACDIIPIFARSVYGKQPNPSVRNASLLAGI
jgi:hypothetical protein